MRILARILDITTKQGLVFLALLVAGTVLFEIAWRTFVPTYLEDDPTLGWQTRANVNIAKRQQRRDGSAYTAHMRTNALGLREAGTPASPGKRILVLGDSYTAEPFASDAGMWFAVLADDLAAAPGIDTPYVQAGGAGGYGTYQALLLADRIADQAKPDVFILQFCGNDFLNNYLPLERHSFARSQYMRRPYYDASNGSAYYSPGIMGSVYRSWAGELIIFKCVDYAIKRIQYTLHNGYYPRDFKPRNDEPLALEAREVTRVLLKKLRMRFQGIPALLVNVSEENVDDLAREAGFIPVGPSALTELSATDTDTGKAFHSDGGHLSDVGNALYGHALARTILASETLRDCFR